jgi:glycerol uptake facilitator-like aquaporin
MKPPLSPRVAAEFLGTMFLVGAVVGSGIMAERLAGVNVAIALLANTIATGAALVALILTFGPISGAHLNPAVSLADALESGISWREVPMYMAAQFIGGILGAVLAHPMFGLRWYSFSVHVRSGSPLALSEFIATFGLVAVIWSCGRSKPNVTPFAVAAYVTSAYWSTASTSFANPAVTVARFVRYICGNSAGGRAVLPCSAGRRSLNGHVSIPLAFACHPHNCARCRRALTSDPLTIMDPMYILYVEYTNIYV